MLRMVAKNSGDIHIWKIIYIIKDFFVSTFGNAPFALIHFYWILEY